MVGVDKGRACSVRQRMRRGGGGGMCICRGSACLPPTDRREYFAVLSGSRYLERIREQDGTERILFILDDSKSFAGDLNKQQVEEGGMGCKKYQHMLQGG